MFIKFSSVILSFSFFLNKSIILQGTVYQGLTFCFSLLILCEHSHIDFSFPSLSNENVFCHCFKSVKYCHSLQNQQFFSLEVRKTELIFFIYFLFQARNMEQKRRWCQEMKRLILESYKGKIPDNVKSLVMQLGRNHDDGMSRQELHDFLIIMK